MAKSQEELYGRLDQIDTEVSAILDGAENENRPLTKEEQADVDKLETEADEARTAIQEQERMQAARRRSEERKAFLNESRARQTHLAPGGSATPETTTEEEEVEKLQERMALTAPPVPISMGGLGLEFQRYPGRLRAFEGSDAKALAYRAGVHLLATAGRGDQREWAKKQCDALEVPIEMLANVQREGSDVYGGYLVFPEFEKSVIKLRNEYGSLRRNARIKPMGSDTLTQPRRTAGLTVYFPEEAGSITQSDMKWDQLSITAKKMAVLAQYSTELDEDGIINLADELADETAYAFAKKEDECGFLGDGTSTYGGFYGITTRIDDNSGSTYSGSIVTATTGNTTFGTLDLVDFEEVLGQVPQYARGRGKWYISNAGFWASMARLVDAAGGNTGAMLQAGVGLRFLGWPVEIVDVMNSTLTTQASTVLLLFGSLPQCVYLGTRRGITVKTSDHRYLEYDKIGFQATQRVGIACYPGDPEAPTTAGGPVLALKTPAA